jgi:purine-nucleoside phosphorylase
MNDDRFGPRFPDMSEPYSNDLIARAEELALKLSIPVRQGVYLALQGPNLETRAEYRMIRTLGADVVGMSTVPEILVARHMGMRTFAVSVITDMCLPDALAEANITEIIATANKAEPKLTKLLAELVRGIDG